MRYTTPEQHKKRILEMASEFIETTNKLVFLEEIQQLLKNDLSNHQQGFHSAIGVKHSCIYDIKLGTLLLYIQQSIDSLRKDHIVVSAITENHHTSENLPKLRWKGSDAELLELAVALTQTGKVVNSEGVPVRTELIDALENIFGRTIKDPDTKISQTKSRKKDKTPFLNSLVEAYTRYLEGLEKKQK